MQDNELLYACLKGDSQAQQMLYERYCARMFAVCFRYAKNRDDAEDMLQESFIKVFKYLEQYKGEGSLEGWIRKIVVHTCINSLKKNKKFKDSVDIDLAYSLKSNADDVPSLLQAKQIIDCVRLLPIGYRTVLNLFAIEGFSHREIAVALDIEESTSRSQYTRAKAMLQNLLIQKNILPATQKQKTTNNINEQAI